jgi:cytochrome c oxidase cbb3-type subunit II
MKFSHAHIEKNLILMAILALITVSIGGLAQIVPLFTVESVIERVDGMRPYTPLELAGRAIYIREGCYVCHSQQIRTFKDEAERYGHYSLAAESMYDHPFQWGSKRTGPDLARVGGKYSNDWHASHLNNPRALAPESIMPGYPFLFRPLRLDNIATHLIANKRAGVPYSEEMIAKALDDLRLQAGATPDEDDTAFRKRYPKAAIGDFDGDPKQITEMDALIAYLQMLGTLVDFTRVDPADLKQ